MMSGISGGISPITPGFPGFQPPTNLPPEINATPTPLDVFVEETRKLGLDPETTSLFDWLEADDKASYPKAA